MRLYQPQASTGVDALSALQYGNGAVTPGTVTATAGDQKITVAWTYGPDVVEFSIYRGVVDAYSSSSVVHTMTNDGAPLAWEDTTGVPGTRYFYWMRAKFTGGALSGTSPVVSAMPYLVLAVGANADIEVPAHVATLGTLFFAATTPIPDTGSLIYAGNNYDLIEGIWYDGDTFEDASDLTVTPGQTFSLNNSTASPITIWNGPPWWFAEFIREVDSRLAIGGDSTIFATQNHAGGIYVRNAGCWGNGIDLTPLSPWNSASGVGMAGVLVSPKHVLFATHYTPATGTTLRWVKQDNTVVTRTLTATAAIAADFGISPDITVGVLDSDVPEGIAFAKVLPADWADYMPLFATYRIPMVATDAEEKLLVADIWAVQHDGTAIVAAGRPTDATRLARYEQRVAGDSGNSSCLVVNGGLVVLTVTGADSGPFVTSFAPAINTAMTALGGGYQLTELDLTTPP